METTIKVIVNGKEETVEKLEEMKKRKDLKVEQISDTEYKTKELLLG